MSRLFDLQDEKQTKLKRPPKPQQWLAILELPNGEKRYANLAGPYIKVIKQRNELLYSDDYVSCWLIQKS